MTPFGEKMRSVRTERGLQLKDMAAGLGVSPAYLSALEHGKRGRPNRRFVHRICQFLGIIWDDAEALQRLTRGQLPVEAALDLHGHTQDQAHAALESFLSELQARGLRCVLVITGKGTTKEAGGVLRAQVPRWLNEPANRARVLAFDYAQPKDGGLGALYVLIRRKRSG